MKCQKCIDANLKSRVFIIGPTGKMKDVVPNATPSDRQQFFDEDGNFHRHDENRHLVSFECSLGHKFEEVFKTDCGKCEWKHP